MGFACNPADLSAVAESPAKFEARPLSSRGVKSPVSLRVFGCLPGAGARGCTAAGVRKASREETAGEFILKAWCQVATSGRHHPPVQHDAPVSAFEAIAKDYPVFRIDPARPT